MSTVPIHPIKYFKVHFHYEEIRVRLQSTLSLVAKNVFNFSEQVATLAVVLLTVGLVIFACMWITKTALVAASFNFAVTEITVPPLQVFTTGI